jgi:hypothetical protein
MMVVYLQGQQEALTVGLVGGNVVLITKVRKWMSYL